MTLGNSICSRYENDERLTVDPPSAMKGPLELIPRPIKRNYVSASTRQSLPQGSTEHRSIFSTYWNTDTPPSRSLSPISSEVEKLQHPQRRRIQKTFTYCYDRNPYQYFGIEEDEGKTSSLTDDEDSDSLNSYEHALQNSEVKVTENNCRRSQTCPSLSYGEVGINRMAHGSTERPIQSDTALFAKTSSSKQRSCLRKNRFSSDSDSCNSNIAQSKRGKGKGEYRTSVTFEPKIKVHLYSPPMERWAPNKWSEWFGGWH